MSSEMTKMLIDTELKRKIADNIMRLKDIGTYRGKRHAQVQGIWLVGLMENLANKLLENRDSRSEDKRRRSKLLTRGGLTGHQLVYDKAVVVVFVVG